MTAQTVDETKVQEFAGRVIGMANSAALMLQTGLGNQRGLLDTLAGLPSATSDQIAAAAGLNEHDVREWQGAMVTGGIITYDPESQTYALPPEHAPVLTRAAGPGNLAVFGEFVALLGDAADGVVESFQNGGGLPYSAFPRFQGLMAEFSSAVVDAALVDVVLPLVPGLVERLQAGIDVADIGCGQGHAINVMARAFPASRFTGYDFAPDGIAAGRAEAERLGLANARFALQDVAQLDVSGAYDLITAFYAIHDQARPRTVLKAIARALRPGGAFLMVDVAASSDLAENVAHPLGPWLYTVSTMHCMTVSLAQGGEGLGTVWGEQKARELLAEAGFTHVDVKQVPGDILNSYYIARKD